MELFELVKKNKINEAITLLNEKGNKLHLNVVDEGGNYLINYIIKFNQIEIIETIIKLKLHIRIDIIDIDGRTILYNCIKYNQIELLKLIINLNNDNIGVSILDIQDKNGYNSLHYAVIFNNIVIFNILLDEGISPHAVAKDKTNIFILCLTYKRNNIINILLEKKYSFNFLNSNNETFLQIAINYNNDEIINKIINSNTDIDLNNTSYDYNLTVLHQTILLDKFNLYEKLLSNMKIDINIADIYGNTILHYIFNEHKISFLNLLITRPELKYNLSNINGQIPLHILLNSYNDFINNGLEKKIIEKIILESDLNMQDNNGMTCLILILNNNLIKEYRDILVIKPLNFFIQNIKQTDEIIDLLIDSYYNQIKHNEKELVIEWEKWCSNDLFEKLKTLYPNSKEIKNNKLNAEQICKIKIKEVIIKEKRSLPKLSHTNLEFNNGILTNMCFYTGMLIDIMFGLLLLYNDFNSIGFYLVLNYPLVMNTELEKYYSEMGIDYPYKLDFSNIEIVWSFQKIFFPSFFNEEVKKIIKKAEYTAIPIGIETSVGSHANILFWDIKNKTLERFEPNGANYPIELNYNPKLLDDIIISKFKEFQPDIKYYAPNTFLPNISFQILENLETEKCKKIGDPNGFCAVWCIWWVYQRLLNINNVKIDITHIANELIKNIKLNNQGFKNIIRNFSNSITKIRDSYLNKYKIDINDWVVQNFDLNIINKIEKDILAKI